MTKEQRFNEYKKLRKTMTITAASKDIGVSQATGSIYNKFKTWKDYQKRNRKYNSRYEKMLKNERYATKLDMAYNNYLDKQDKKSLKEVEKLLPKVTWRFAPKVPTWMKKLFSR